MESAYVQAATVISPIAISHSINCPIGCHWRVCWCYIIIPALIFIKSSLIPALKGLYSLIEMYSSVASISVSDQVNDVNEQ